MLSYFPEKITKIKYCEKTCWSVETTSIQILMKTILLQFDDINENNVGDINENNCSINVVN